MACDWPDHRDDGRRLAEIPIAEAIRHACEHHADACRTAETVMLVAALASNVAGPPAMVAMVCGGARALGGVWETTPREDVLRSVVSLAASALDIAPERVTLVVSSEAEAAVRH